MLSATPLCNSLNTIHFQKNSVKLCVTNLKQKTSLKVKNKYKNQPQTTNNKRETKKVQRLYATLSTQSTSKKTP